MSAIKAGDVVEVVGACCHLLDARGRITHVREVQTNMTTSSPCCGVVIALMTCAHLTDVLGCGWVPVAWLRKLTPDDPVESIEHREELTA